MKYSENNKTTVNIKTTKKYIVYSPYWCIWPLIITFLVCFVFFLPYLSWFISDPGSLLQFHIRLIIISCSLLYFRVYVKLQTAVRSFALMTEMRIHTKAIVRLMEAL